MFLNPRRKMYPQPSPVRCSNHWATMTQMAERRPRYVPVRKRDIRTDKQQSRYVSISYILHIYSLIRYTDISRLLFSSTCVALTNRYTSWPSLCHLSPGSSMVRAVSPEIRRFPSGAQKHWFFWVCDKAWVANSFPLIYQAASHPSYIYIIWEVF